MSLTEEREAQLVSSLAYHIRMVGFTVQVESYFYDESRSRRPDLAIYLPASSKYIFLEVKIVGPNGGYLPALEDVKKQNSVVSARDKRNGLIALGFRNPTGKKETFENKYKKLSLDIQSKYPYREIGIKKIDLEGMDSKAVYAMAGL
jgi:hypothetical protein